ncbi:MrcB family domain-containing protein [Levilactobacillus fujinensis]|uniref:MrcB family domain-containing protein n=1 Tax=Levilactobacillus fujinensis TaxID=2486024 RepID=A0ABW1TIV0_9LACO|nr:DUF3578 domain-containing protein [Levilactobacillus fujinensis]
MKLVNLFKRISNEYAVQKKVSRSFAKNTLIRDCKSSLVEALSLNKLPTSYHAKFSAGVGNWAEIPWIAIQDDSILNTTAQHGIYIVLLFTNDYKGVYLTLGQGWTFFEEKYKNNDPQDKIQFVSSFFYSRLQSSASLMQFSGQCISLNRTDNKSSRLVTGYEDGTILSKYYDISQLSDDSNSALTNDLLNMSECYQQVQQLLLEPKDYMKTVDVILANTSHRSVDYSTIESTDSRVSEDQQPYDVLQKYGVKPDYNTLSQHAASSGKQGEEYAMSYEQNRLAKDPLLSKVRDKLKHVSKEDGDGLGYDILSQCIDPKDPSQIKDLYIEVKTTYNPSETTPFFMSANELKFFETCKHNGQSYVIYRVYGDSSHRKIKILTPEIISQADFKPTNYQVSQKR